MSKAERTREFIIKKTAPIFNMKGFAGTSLSDMTEATGLTKGSIYGNFTDKDEVALAAFDHNTKVVSGAIRAEMAKQASYRDKLMVYVEFYGNFPKYTFFEGGCPVLNTLVEADDTHPKLKEKAVEALLRWKDRLAGIIEEGIAAGEFKADTNAEDTAVTMIALFEGAILFTKATGKMSYKKAIVNSVEKLIKAL
ncbi:MAG TPA: TetR/AcrR family transcriptional regulator [Puia sp.]|nr:TetR/AcrR family transcriptional regulator [Puia sp.]